MDGLEGRLKQLMQHLKIVNDKMLSPLASKVCLCVVVIITVQYSVVEGEYFHNLLGSLIM